MKLLLVFPACIFSLSCFAQRIVDVDKTDGVPSNTFVSVGGEVFTNTRFVRLVEGSPYFKNDWIAGTGISANGERYKAGLLKIDLYDHQVHYLDATGNEMVATSPLKQLILNDSLAGKTYRFIHSSLFPVRPLQQGWYLQLASGKADLYQYFVKQVSESQRYGSSTKEQHITTIEQFYLVRPGSIVQIKKPADVPALLPDKQKELEDWLQNAHAKKGSTGEQLTALIVYYNGLE